ncbi:hypothetical protein ACFRDV_40355 [Streptomyces fagopyri]|uniref:hypothetical protein n=1 Tax=Streptomyces fagopyri TaxID=2662397 RepID=UPI00369C0F01
MAAQLAAIEDLQQRVDGSHEARIMHAIRHGKETPLHETPQEPLVWPRALRECVAEDERFLGTPPPLVDDCLDADWQREQQEADSVHRLLGLISYAVNSRNIELRDLSDLHDAIFDLCNDSQQATKGRD